MGLRQECEVLVCFQLRKEVIHPHLPVRIPCYDLVLVADPALVVKDRFGRCQLRWLDGQCSEIVLNIAI